MVVRVRVVGCVQVWVGVGGECVGVAWVHNILHVFGREVNPTACNSCSDNVMSSSQLPIESIRLLNIFLITSNEHGYIPCVQISPVSTQVQYSMCSNTNRDSIMLIAVT